MINIKVFDTYVELCKNAFEKIVSLLSFKPNSVLCVATGDSPLGLYSLFPQQKELFQNVKILKLDEWGGIKSDDPSTCESYIKDNIIWPLGIDKNQLLGFRSDAENPEDECERIKRLIKQYSVDVCILGIGIDGHIGLNFPANTLIPEVHTVPAEYLTHSMLDKAREKPTHGYTLGMKEIIHSKEIILIVKGKTKSNALTTLLKSGITTHFPASLLMLSENLTIYCDKEAYTQ